jgi:multiple sugar transport system substrate-binding protein
MSRGTTRRTLLAAGAGALALAATPRAQSAPARITFAWPFAGGERGMQILVNRFNEGQRAIQVEMQVVPQVQAIPRLTTAFTGGAGPDCLAMSDAWLSQFAGGGWLENLDPLLAGTSIEQDIVPGSMQIARMLGGRAFYVGYMVEAYSLYYNRRLFQEAGLAEPPATIEAFRDAAIRLTDARRNRYGYYVLGGTGWQFQQWSTWMLNHGGTGVDRTIFDAEGRCVLAGARHVEGLEKWVALYQRDRVSPLASATGTFQDQTNAFAAGQVAMVMGWGIGLSTLAEAVGEDNLGVAAMPAGPAGQYFYHAGNGFSLNAASRQKDAAWEFLRWLLRRENMEFWNREFGAIPANMTVWEAEWLRAPKYRAPMAMIRATDQLLRHPRHLPGYASFQAQFAPEQIQRTLLGRQTAAQHAQAIANALNELRARAG